MSIIDTILDLIIWTINNVLIKIFPDSYQGLDPNTFSNYVFSGFTFLSNGFNFIEYFIALKLILVLVGIILLAEPLLHLAYKPVMWLIKFIRG